MGFFDDMVAAVQAYPTTNVQLEIVDFDTPGDALNEGEVATFKVRITNTGPLTMTDVALKLTALNNAHVKGPEILDTFGPHAVSRPIDQIRAGGGSQTTLTLHLKAPSHQQTSKNLVQVTLDTWDANLDYILNRHSTATDNPRAVLASEVQGL